MDTVVHPCSFGKRVSALNWQIDMMERHVSIIGTTLILRLPISFREVKVQLRTDLITAFKYCLNQNVRLAQVRQVIALIGLLESKRF